MILRGYTILIFVVVAFSTLFFTMMMACGYIILLTKKEDVVSTSKLPEKYLVTNYDPETNISSSGFAEIGDKQLTGEYDTFEDPSGHVVMLSRFKSDVYQCTGSCYCGEERRSARVLASGLIHLVSAVSAVIAYSKAKEYFKEKCARELSDSCSWSSVFADILDCDIKKYENQFVEHGTEIRRFWCTGRCLPKLLRHSEAREKALFFGCESLETDGNVDVVPDSSSEMWNKPATEKFRKTILKPYCRENSYGKIGYVSKGQGVYADREYRHWKKVVLCCAQNQYKKNTTISCIQVYPVPWVRKM